MFCKNCGVKINNGANFCSSCGQKFGTIPLKRQERKFDFGREYLLWMVISVVIIFVAFYFAFENYLAAFILAIIFGSVSSLLVTLLRKEYIEPTKKEDRAKNTIQPVINKKKKISLAIAGYVMAAMISVTTQKMHGVDWGESVGSIIGIIAGFSYYKLCVKYHHKQNIAIYLFPALLVIASFLTGFLLPPFKALLLWWANR